MGTDTRQIARIAALTGIIACGTLSSRQPAHAGIPPEVPSRRTSQVFAPYYFQLGENGESVFLVSAYGGHGPRCQEYSVSLDYLETEEPSPYPTVTLNNFIELLQTPAGIAYITGHANIDVLAVEAYRDRAFADGRRAYYELQHIAEPGELVVGEVGIIEGSPKLYAIAVTEGFISRHLAEHSLVHVQACDSLGLSQAFIGSQHKVRNFVGMSGEIPGGQLFGSIGYDIATKIYRNMCGASNDSGQYTNLPFGQAVGLAQSQVYNFMSYRSDSAAPNADNMRLYIAPRLVFADATQDVDGNNSFSKSLYHYQFGSAYPYNPGNTSNYPGQLGEKGIAGTGPIRIALRFSEPMDAGWDQLKVQLRFSDGTTQDITGNWASAILPNDNWSATTILPSNAPDGEVKVAVRARKVQCGPGMDTALQELDTDGDGTSTAGTYDTQVSFPIADPCFLVERKKLIFSDFAAKAHLKPGSYDIHNRKTHALSVTAARPHPTTGAAS